MTNEEAFEKWFCKQLDTEYAFTSDEQITRWAWNAAIAYMQEQDKLAEQSEPVGYVSRKPIQSPQAIVAKANDILNIPVYTTPQRQHPLKRLSDEKILEIAYKVHEGISPHNDTMDFANAIMDEMERINRE